MAINPLATTAAAAANSNGIVDSRNVTLTGSQVCYSWYLADDPMLEEILKGHITLSLASNPPNEMYGADYVKKIGIALKIILPQLTPLDPAVTQHDWVGDPLEPLLYNSKDLYDYLHADDPAGFHPTETFTQQIKDLIGIYETLKAHESRIHLVLGLGLDPADIDVRNEVTKKVDRHILRAIDDDLVKIEFFDPEKQKVIHNASKAINVGSFTRVYKETGVNLYKEPYDVGANIIDGVYQYTRVFVESLLPDDWAYVKIWYTDMYPGPYPDDENQIQIKGYMKQAHLWLRTKMPEPSAELYKIQKTSVTLQSKTGDGGDATEPDTNATLYQGESLFDIAYAKYAPPGTSDVRAFNYNLPSGATVDIRYFVNVLLYVNNPGGQKFRDYKVLDPDTGQFTKEVYSRSAVFLEDQSKLADFIGNFVDNLGKEKPSTEAHEQTWANWEGRMDSADKAGTRFSDANKEVTVGDYHIWVPSVHMAESLYNIVSIGSYIPIANVFDNINNWMRDLNGILKTGLDAIWPVGMGVSIEMGLGAAFAIPITVDGTAQIELKRTKDNEFKLSRQGKIGVGASLEASAGFFLGSSSRQYSNDFTERRFGIGGVLEASYKESVEVQIVQEMTFDLTRDWAVISLMAGAFMQDGMVSGYDAASKFAHTYLGAFEFVNINPNMYTTKLALGISKNYEGEISGKVGMFLGQLGPEAHEGSSDWEDSGKRGELVESGEGYLWPWVINLFCANFKIDMKVALAAGIEVEFDGGLQYIPSSGLHLPEKASVKIGFDVEAQGSVNAASGALSTVTKIVNSIAEVDTTFDFSSFSFAGEIGFGAEFKVDCKFAERVALASTTKNVIDGNSEAKDQYELRALPAPSFDASTLTIAAFQKRGGLDSYDGPAFKKGLELNLNWKDLLNFDGTNIVDALIKAVTALKIEQRVMIDMKDILKNYWHKDTFEADEQVRKLEDKQSDAPTKWWEYVGVSVNIYFTTAYELPTHTWAGMFRNMYDAWQKGESITGYEIIKTFVLVLLDYIQLRNPDSNFLKFASDMASVITTISKAELYVEAKGGFEVDAKVAAAAKAKVKLNGGLAISYTKDLVEYLNKFEGQKFADLCYLLWTNPEKFFRTYMPQTGEKAVTKEVAPATP
ncbi:MAG: hypothetical protein AAF587_33710 [Bacteroidota bacterium]